MSEPVGPRVVFRWSVAAALGVLAVAIAAWAVYTVRAVLVLAIVALFVAVSLDPAVRWLIRHRVRRPLAVGLIFVGAVIFAGGLAWAVVPPLVSQAATLSADLPGYIDRATEASKPLRDLGERYGFTDSLRDLAKDLPGQIGSNVVAFMRTLFGAIFSGVTIIVLTIYFMADLPRLRSGVVRLFPPVNRPHVRTTVDVMVDKVGSYMIGNVIVSLVAGVSSFLALTLLGAPFALPLAVVVAITDLIPLIGATLGAIVCVVVTLLSDNLWPTAVLVAIFFVVYQQVENYLIAPRVLRNAVDISAVAVLIAGLVGAAVLGLIGALMAIPIAAAIKVLITPRLEAMDAAAAPGNGPGNGPGNAPGGPNGD